MNEPSAMKISSHCSEGVSTQLAVQGAMTIYEADAIKHELLGALNASPGLVLDLALVDEIDTAGLQLLMLLQREAARDGKPLQLGARSAAVDEVLERYGLGDVFDAPALISRDVAALADTIASERISHEP
jgi:anti-sigma B factor antagonist